VIPDPGRQRCREGDGEGGASQQPECAVGRGVVEPVAVPGAWLYPVENAAEACGAGKRTGQVDPGGDSEGL